MKCGAESQLFGVFGREWNSLDRRDSRSSLPLQRSRPPRPGRMHLMLSLLRNLLSRAKPLLVYPGRLGGQPLMKQTTSGTMASPKKVQPEQKHQPALRMAHVATRVAKEMDLQQPMPRHDLPRRSVTPLLGARPPPSTTRAPGTISLPDHL